MRLPIAVAVLAAMCVPVQTARAQVSCAKWGTASFFKRATPIDVRRCIDGGARANYPRQGGLIPIHRAAKFTKHAGVIAALIEAGANVGAEAGGFLNYKARPLHYAAERRNAATVIRALLAGGADPNVANTNGNTPLHYASDPEASIALVEAGADPNRENGRGETPMDWAGDRRKAILIAAGGRQKRTTRTQSGLGALVTGVAVAAAGTAAGLDEDEALATAQDAAQTVYTGTPTVRATDALRQRRDTEHRIEAEIQTLESGGAEQAGTTTGAEETGLDAGQRASRLEDTERKRQAEAARRRHEDALRRQAEIRRRNAEVMNGDCSCIRIEDDGEYTCLDGLVVGNSSQSRIRLCDIKR